MSTPSIPDAGRRKIMSITYLPIFELFLETVPQFCAALVPEDCIEDMMSDLRAGYAAAEKQSKR